MYAAGYRVPDSLRLIDTRRVGSLSQADSYVPPPNAWQQHTSTPPQDGRGTQNSMQQRTYPPQASV